MAYEEELKAIHQYCLHNCERGNNGSELLVERCWDNECPLHFYRMGIDPEQIQTRESEK